MRRFIAFGPALVVLLTALVTLVAAPAAVRMVGYAAIDAQVQAARQALEQDNVLKQIDRAVRNIANAVEPSVVHIAVDEPSGRGGRMVRLGQGSGWVFDVAGHIVTNAHVVRGARRIMVQFQDGRVVQAETVGHDPTTDIAVIKVTSTEGLVPAQRATGLELSQGDRVYAFGSPFGFKFSMSEGIVSGLGRDPRTVIGSEGFTNFIQTDAAVNPGNSGGPLVNVEGKVVGMNVAIATAPGVSNGEGQNSGISFAIPLVTIESVVEQIINGGVIAKGYLGISRPPSDDVNAQLLSERGFRGRGVVATDIVPGGPADKAGLKAGDIITRLNNQVVTGIPVLRSSISNNAPGDKITVEVWRDGKTLSFSVTLANLPPTPQELQEAAEIAQRIGLVSVSGNLDGSIEISEIRAPSPAFQAGLRPGQIIVSVEGVALKAAEAPITPSQSLLSALVEHGLHQGRDVTITVQAAQGKTLDVKLSPR